MINGTPMFPFLLTYFHMYKTGFTGLSGYFLPFQMKGKNSNPSPRDLEVVEHIESESKISLIRSVYAMEQ